MKSITVSSLADFEGQSLAQEEGREGPPLYLEGWLAPDGKVFLRPFKALLKVNSIFFIRELVSAKQACVKTDFSLLAF